jgi:hypothetical protein
MIGGRLIPIIGVIILFLGVGIHPAFAVYNEQLIVSEKIDYACGCNDVSNIDLVQLNKLANRIKHYCKLLVVLSENDLVVKMKYDQIIDIIDSTSDFKEFLCDIVTEILEIIYDLADYLYEKGVDNAIINVIVLPLFFQFFVLQIMFCLDFDPYYP